MGKVLLIVAVFCGFSHLGEASPADYHDYEWSARRCAHELMLGSITAKEGTSRAAAELSKAVIARGLLAPQPRILVDSELHNSLFVFIKWLSHFAHSEPEAILLENLATAQLQHKFLFPPSLRKEATAGARKIRRQILEKPDRVFDKEFEKLVEDADALAYEQLPKNVIDAMNDLRDDFNRGSHPADSLEQLLALPAFLQRWLYNNVDMPLAQFFIIHFCVDSHIVSDPAMELRLLARKRVQQAIKNKNLEIVDDALISYLGKYGSMADIDLLKKLREGMGVGGANSVLWPLVTDTIDRIENVNTNGKMRELELRMRYYLRELRKEQVSIAKVPGLAVAHYRSVTKDYREKHGGPRNDIPDSYLPLMQWLIEEGHPFPALVLAIKIPRETELPSSLQSALLCYVGDELDAISRFILQESQETSFTDSLSSEQALKTDAQAFAKLHFIFAFLARYGDDLEMERLEDLAPYVEDDFLNELNAAKAQIAKRIHH